MSRSLRSRPFDCGRRAIGKSHWSGQCLEAWKWLGLTAGGGVVEGRVLGTKGWAGVRYLGEGRVGGICLGLIPM